jgi:shikimate kinase
MIISLTGFMGCGKSSVGRKLSALLSCSYIDLDSVIEEKSGRSIPEIFADDGEAMFRLMEMEALCNVIRDCQDGDNKPSHVLALGGGTIMTPECAGLVQKNTFCIYLRASADTLFKHLENEAEGRPMLSSAQQDNACTSESDALRKRISELMDSRSETYEKTAHVIIDTDGRSVGEIAEEIITEFRRAHACL